MVTTYLQVTNPMPAGNITLAADTEIDGSEGTVTHTGGYVRMSTYGTNYYFRVLSGTTFDQAGGHLTGETGGAYYIQEEDTLVRFSGSDRTYSFTFVNNLMNAVYINGTLANPAIMKGIDNTHRMARMSLVYTANIIAYYWQISEVYDAANNYDLDIHGTNHGYFYGCTFSLSYSSNLGQILIQYQGIIIFENCTFTCVNYMIYQIRGTYVFLLSCTITQVSTERINYESPYLGFVLYYNLTFTNAAPTDIGLVGLGSYTETVTHYKLHKLSVAEGNSLSDCNLSLVHKKYDDYENLSNFSTALHNYGQIGLLLTKYGVNLLVQNKVTVTGAASVYVVKTVYSYNRALAAYTALDISVSGGAYTYNDQYTLTLSKVGYRPQTADYWGSSDQTWNVTLVPETTFTDITDAIDDMMGTGFVRDTDSLVNLAHTGADGDTLETLSDQLDLVQTTLGDIEGAGFAPGTDDLEHIASSARNSYYASKTGGKR